MKRLLVTIRREARNVLWLILLLMIAYMIYKLGYSRGYNHFTREFFSFVEVVKSKITWDHQ